MSIGKHSQKILVAIDYLARQKRRRVGAKELAGVIKASERSTQRLLAELVEHGCVSGDNAKPQGFKFIGFGSDE